jgi:putative transposase
MCTVKRDGKRWTASVVCDIGQAPEKQAVSRAVGIDVGIAALATLSDGQIIENPRWTRKHEMRIATANRKLALKQKRSKNRLRAREALRRVHQRAANARRNFTHHASKWLVSNYDLIAFEKLNIQGMAQSRLAKSILDAAWAELIWQISYKAESAGRWAIPVNPRGTSIRCSSCGADVPKTLADRQHICVCGTSLDRDHNAALNILALGQSAVREIPAECQGVVT